MGQQGPLHTEVRVHLALTRMFTAAGLPLAPRNFPAELDRCIVAFPFPDGMPLPLPASLASSTLMRCAILSASRSRPPLATSLSSAAFLAFFLACRQRCGGLGGWVGGIVGGCKGQG